MARPAEQTFSKDEVRRYSRHFILPEFGVRGQKRLKAARVLCIGAGGLGSPAAMYLAAAGVGTLGIVDFDVVDLSNLQRQILHATPDVGRSKLDSAAERLRALNPEVRVVTHAQRVDSSSALALVEQYDLVLDGTDNYSTRYVINDACVMAGRPNVSASVFRFEGQVSIFATPEGPCYRCLYPQPPPPGVVPSCGEGGILGIVTGVVGTLQATEAIKYLAGIGQSLVGRLTLFDALEMRFRELKIRKSPECPACGPAPTITRLFDYESFCGLKLPVVDELSPLQVKARLDAKTPLQLIDVREPGEREINGLPGALAIPFDELERRAAEIAVDRPVVFFCRVGTRSAQAVSLVRSLGLTEVFNLTGGISQWLEDIDDDQPGY